MGIQTRTDPMVRMFPTGTADNERRTKILGSIAPLFAVLAGVPYTIVSTDRHKEVVLNLYGPNYVLRPTK